MLNDLIQKKLEQMSVLIAELKELLGRMAELKILDEKSLPEFVKSSTLHTVYSKTFKDQDKIAFGTAPSIVFSNP